VIDALDDQQLHRLGLAIFLRDRRQTFGVAHWHFVIQTGMDDQERLADILQHAAGDKVQHALKPRRVADFRMSGGRSASPFSD
jgi:hypothetical protein